MQLQRVLPLLGVAFGLTASALYVSHNSATADAIPVSAITPVVIAPTIPFGLANLDLTTAVEGPLQHIDVAGRQLMVNGTVLNVPLGLLIDVNNDGVGDKSLEALMGAPGERSPVGGTIIATATGIRNVDSGAVSFTADSLYFDFGEQVVVGPLLAVDAAAGTFTVGGHVVRMSTDSRMLPRLLDLGGHDITISQLNSWLGSSVTCEGYTQDVNGVNCYFAKHVDTEVIVPSVTADGVAVARVLWNAKDGNIDVVGTVTAGTDGTLSQTVKLYWGGCSAANHVAAGGLVAGIAPALQGITVNVLPGAAANLGDFKYRSARGSFPTNPGCIWVDTQLGGKTQRTTDVK